MGRTTRTSITMNRRGCDACSQEKTFAHFFYNGGERRAYDGTQSETVGDLPSKVLIAVGGATRTRSAFAFARIACTNKCTTRAIMLFLFLLFFPSRIGFSEYEVTLLDDLAINVAFQF